MGKSGSGGFRLVRDKRSGNWLAKFYVEGREKTRSTFTRDRAEAKVIAAQHYAETISGRQRVDAPQRGDLAQIFADWLAAIEGTTSAHDFKNCMGTIERHLLPQFPRIEYITVASCEDFYRARLREVSRETVRKERGVLSRFTRWASAKGRDLIPPLDVPPISKKARGTPQLKGRNYTEVSRAETLAILDALPERSERGRVFSGFNYLKTFRNAAETVIGAERARYLALRDLRHAAITELAEHTGNLAAVAAVAGHKDLRTTSRYFHASAKAASAALRARTEADVALEIAFKRGTESGTERIGENAEETSALKKGHGRVAQLDRALPSGGNTRERFPCKERRNVSFGGSHEHAGKGTATRRNWNGSGLDHRLMLRRAWGALRCI